MEILVINGPNLNLLGKRKPDIYGHRSSEDMEKFIRKYFQKVELTFFQSNSEGEIIDKIQQAEGKYQAIAMNAGAYTHYSYAIRDAIEAIDIPVVEVHISNTAAREEFRHKSVISEVCTGTVAGFGAYSYVMAIQALAHRLKRESE